MELAASTSSGAMKNDISFLSGLDVKASILIQ